MCFLKSVSCEINLLLHFFEAKRQYLILHLKGKNVDCTSGYEDCILGSSDWVKFSGLLKWVRGLNVPFWILSTCVCELDNI